MDLTSQYCPERKRLEAHCWNLVSRLDVLTQQLMALIGKDHTEFVSKKDECTEVKQEIYEYRDQLHVHRAGHGC